MFIWNPEQSGIVRLGHNGTLSTSSPGSQSSSVENRLSLNNLALHLPTLLADTSISPVISVHESSITSSISGDLLFLNEDNESPYDSLDLSTALTRVPLLHLSEAVDADATTNAEGKGYVTPPSDEELDNSVNKVDHYGHVGKWTLYWEKYTTKEDTTSLDTVNKYHRVLYANWAPIAYLPNLKFKTPLVANSLWESFYIASSEIGQRSIFFKKFGIYGGARGLIHRQRTRSDCSGFHMNTLLWLSKLALSSKFRKTT